MKKTISQATVTIERLIRADGNFVVMPNEADLILRQSAANAIMAEANMNKQSAFEDVQRMGERQAVTATMMLQEIAKQRQWLVHAREYVDRWLSASSKDRDVMEYTYERKDYHVRNLTRREKVDIRQAAQKMDEKTTMLEIDMTVYNDLSFMKVVSDGDGNSLSQDQVDDIDDVDESILWRQIDALRNPQVLDLVPFTTGGTKT